MSHHNYASDRVGSFKKQHPYLGQCPNRDKKYKKDKKTKKTHTHTHKKTKKDKKDKKRTEPPHSRTRGPAAPEVLVILYGIVYLILWQDFMGWPKPTWPPQELEWGEWQQPKILVFI